MKMASTILLALVSVAAASPTVLVTGATGRTGSILYAQLKADSRIGTVKAMVRAGQGSEDKARAALNCSKCDTTEGIYYGDVTDLASLVEPTADVDTLAITVGVAETLNKTLMKAVEFTGVKNQVAAFASHGDVASKRVVLLSSMETTNPHPLPFEGGPVLFWKLNAEAFLGATGVGSAIVKPCGISGSYGRGGKQLLVGHADEIGHAGAISREDLAAVMVEAIVERATNLRFDLCLGTGPATTDLAGLLKSAHYTWDQ